MTYCATQVKFEENITSIFPRKGEEDYTVRVFDNLRIKDKIIVMFSLRDTVATDTRELAACADAYDQALMRADGGTHIAATMSSIEGKTVGEVSRFVRQYLPLFLSPADFARFDTITTNVPATWLKTINPKLYVEGINAENLALARRMLGNGLPFAVDFTLFPWSHGRLHSKRSAAPEIEQDAYNNFLKGNNNFIQTAIVINRHRNTGFRSRHHVDCRLVLRKRIEYHA